MVYKILVVDDEIDTLRLVGLMLERQGYEIAAAKSGVQALKTIQTEKPDLILLDVVMPDMDGFEVAKRLREDDEFYDIPIVMFTAKAQVDDKITGLESGADVYLTKPTQPRELFTQIKVLLDRSKKVKTTPLPKDGKRGFSIGIIAAKGGLGVSTTVINLGVSLHRATNQKTLVVDLQPGRGDISWELGFTAQVGISDLIEIQPSLITNEIIDDHVVIHNSGIHLLLASQSPKEADQIYQSDAFREIINRLPYLARWVISDLGSILLPTTQTATKLCDILLVVISPEPLVVQQTAALLGDLMSIGIEEQRLVPILVNRFESSPPLTLQQVENQLGYPISAVLTPATELAQQASMSNNPMVIQQPNSVTTKQYMKLTEMIAARNPQWKSHETSPRRTLSTL